MWTSISFFCVPKKQFFTRYILKNYKFMLCKGTSDPFWLKFISLNNKSQKTIINNENDSHHLPFITTTNLQLKCFDFHNHPSKPCFINKQFCRMKKASLFFKTRISKRDVGGRGERRSRRRGGAGGKGGREIFITVVH